MGAVRKQAFDAVVGVGGIGFEAEASGIARKINWIGVGPHKHSMPGKRGPIVAFKHFLAFGSNGPDFRASAPTLAEWVYAKNIRHVVICPGTGQNYMEALNVIKKAGSAPPSVGRLGRYTVCREPHPYFCCSTKTQRT